MMTIQISNLFSLHETLPAWNKSSYTDLSNNTYLGQAPPGEGEQNTCQYEITPKQPVTDPKKFIKCKLSLAKCGLLGTTFNS